MRMFFKRRNIRISFLKYTHFCVLANRQGAFNHRLKMKTKNEKKRTNKRSFLPLYKSTSLWYEEITGIFVPLSCSAKKKRNASIIF